MVTLFRKIFIKNYLNVCDDKVRQAHGKLASFFGIFSNAILFTLKLVFGLLAASISIVADSINNLSDFANSFITLIGFKISSKPADKKHPFGHQRIEYIIGLIVSIVVIALAITLIYSSINKIIDGTKATYDLWSFIILGVSIVLKLLQAYFNYKMSKVINSIALKAVAVDSLTDTISTTLLLVSALISYFLHINIDGYMGIVIGLFVGFSGIKMVLETSSPLIGEASTIEDIKKISDVILSYKGVLGIHDVLAHNYGPNRIYMSVHVEVDSKVDVMVSHDLIDNIENDIKSKFKVELTIHMDPVDISNPEVKRLKEKTVTALKSIDSSLTLHDFRVVFGASHINLIFDIEESYDFKMNEEELHRKLTDLVNENEQIKLIIVMKIDRLYVEK